MNDAMLRHWIGDRVEDLVEMGVPRDEAEHVMEYVRVAAHAAEANAKVEAQFLLDFKRNGSSVLAERHGCTPQNIRKLRQRVLQKRNLGLRAKLR